MDNQLIWKDEFNIGIKIIDEEHQRLFRIINKLFALRGGETRYRRTCQEGIKYFKTHALKHFEDEETYMELIHYKDIKMHKRLTETSGRNPFRRWKRSCEEKTILPLPLSISCPSAPDG